MRNLMVSAASVLCLLCWTAPSASKFQLLEVRSGVGVTLLCPNFTSAPFKISWFRALRKSEPRQISTIISAEQAASTLGEFQDRFETTSNLSIIILRIKRVDLSDSGLYFCGYLMMNNPIIMSPTYIEVEVFAIDESAKTTKLVCVLLGALSVFLIVALVGLGIVIKRLHTALSREKHQKEGQGADVNCATVGFKRQRSHRSASEREDLDGAYSTIK